MTNIYQLYPERDCGQNQQPNLLLPNIMNRCVTSLLVISLSIATGCTPLPYQEAQPIAIEASSGYLDEEMAPGVHIVEVRHITPIAVINNQDKRLITMKEQWVRRSQELCKFGYRGAPEVITSANARIKAFQCTGTSCSQSPLVSGVIWCHQRYEL